ncbi:MAG: hypothetical protein ACR2GY_08050 [Phycisphaerales bacterium]
MGVEATLTPGKLGQFEVKVDGESIATRGGNMVSRMFGKGYPDFSSVVAAVKERIASG